MERSPADYEGLAYNEVRGSFDDMPPARQSAAAVAATALVRDPHTGATAAQLNPVNRATSPGYAISKEPYMQLVDHGARSAASASTTTTPQHQNPSWYNTDPITTSTPMADPINRTTTPGSAGARNMLPSQMRRSSQQVLGRSQTDLTKMGNGSALPPPVPPKEALEDEDEQWRREALGYLGYAGVGGHYGRWVWEVEIFGEGVNGNGNGNVCRDVFKIKRK
jgi:hypothetical protein